jgi:hypothetical protein
MKLMLTAVVCVSMGHANIALAQAEEAADQAAEQPGHAPQAVQPPTPAPTQLPPAPPPQPPAPPQDVASQQAQSPGVPVPGQAMGQWVYTGQYGWVFMPYGDQYVSEGAASDEYPYSYVYYPTYGWAWLAAPWVWGWGPYPYFGVWGPGRFGWYAGLYRAGYGWGGYRGGGARGYAGLRASAAQRNVRSNNFHAAPPSSGRASGGGTRGGGHGGHH